MKKKNLAAAGQNAMEKEFEICYSLEMVYSQGFFKRLEKVGNKVLNDFVGNWLDTVKRETEFTDRTLLETIHNFTVFFLETAIKRCKNVATAVVPIDDGKFLFGYDLDKNKSVFLFNILQKK